jgi:hypothetical protein
MTKTPPPDISRDEFGRWTTMSLPPPPDSSDFSGVRLRTLAEVREDFSAQNIANSRKYNKFFEWEHGVSVVPNFPFDVRLCVVYEAQKADGYDTYRYDPAPLDWVLNVVENPTKEPDPQLKKFDISSFYRVYGYRFETIEEAREANKNASIQLIAHYTEYPLVALEGRQMDCSKCSEKRPFAERTNYPDTPDANIALEPMQLYDTMKFHQCGKKT